MYGNNPIKLCYQQAVWLYRRLSMFINIGEPDVNARTLWLKNKRHVTMKYNGNNKGI